MRTNPRCIAILARDKIPYYEVTLPRIKHWAERIHADVHIIDTYSPEYPTGMWDKLWCFKQFPGYERYLALDADIAPVRWRADSVFERLFDTRFDIQMSTLRDYPAAVPGWIMELPNGNRQLVGDPHYNAGVVSMSPKAIQKILEIIPTGENANPGLIQEEFWLNWLVMNDLDLSFRQMPSAYNFAAACFGENVGHAISNAHLVHFPGHWRKPIIEEWAQMLYPL